MKNPLRLNDYNVRRNAAAGSHDPSMMFDPITRKYYSYCTDIYGPPLGLPAQIGIPVRSSPDLVHFTYEGIVMSDAAIAEGRCNGEYPDTVNFWAPYVEYIRGEYRMYYSATRAFGSSESRIWLAVAKNPLGPFENRGVAADTWGTDDTYPNAIDPHIIWDAEKCFLVYGSFFGGIYIKELNPATGLPLDGNPKTLGRCISRKAKHPRIDGPEGAAIAYVKETGYYYLFQSYGWLGEDYDIRVGRSRCVTGPYRDRQGRDLVGESMGDKLAGSYRFQASAPPAGEDKQKWKWDGFRAPGHGVPFYDPVRKGWFFVHHIRDGARVNREIDRLGGRASYRWHYMMVRAMFFLDGWPVLSPEPYAGEPLREQIRPEEAAGRWELIFFDDDSNKLKTSRICSLSADHPYLRRGRLLRCWDFENQKTVTALTGTDDFGIAYWGKLLYNLE